MGEFVNGKWIEDCEEVIERAYDQHLTIGVEIKMCDDCEYRAHYYRYLTTPRPKDYYD